MQTVRRNITISGRKHGLAAEPLSAAAASRSAAAARIVSERDQRNKSKAGRLGGLARAAKRVIANNQTPRISNAQVSELAAANNAPFRHCEWGCGAVLPVGVIACRSCQIKRDSVVPQPERREPDLSNVRRILTTEVPRLIAMQRQRYGAP